MEEEWVKKAKKGDKLAFEKIIEFYMKDMYMIARSKLNSYADVEDAIQDTILEIYTGLWMLRDNSKFKAWMARSLVNNCNDILRQNKKYEYLDDEESIVSTYNDGIEDHEFFDLIDFLKEEDRTILIMKYFQGYTFVEISKILKLKESTVRMRALRLKEKIKQRLGDDEIGK